MTQKAALLEYFKQIYPEWRLGGMMNGVVFYVKDQRYTSGFRGDRNCRQLAKEKKLEKKYTDEGYAMYRAKKESIQLSIL